MGHRATIRRITVFLGGLFLLFSGICVREGYAQTLSADERARLAPRLRVAATSSGASQLAPLSSSEAVEAGRTSPNAEARYGVFVYTSDLDVFRGMNLPVRPVGPGLATARLTASGLRTVAQMAAVTYVQPARSYDPMNDVVRGVTGVQAVQAGVFGREYTGEGVLACMVDTGIDWTHRDFRGIADTSRSRILAIWDQTLAPRPGEKSPAGFGYGVQYTRRDIEDEIDGTPARAVRSTDTDGHGTHVAGTIAGNGAASPGQTHRGMAPNADIVAVKTDFTGVRIADGIRYCGAMAERTDQPVVVNLSLGRMGGPQDGTAPLSQVISDFAGPGRSVVVAAGNGGDAQRHVSRSLKPGMSDSLRVRVPRSSSGERTDRSVAFRLDTWFAGATSGPMTLLTPGGARVPLVSDTAATVQTRDGSVTYENAVGPRGDRHVELLVHDTKAAAPPANGTWTVVLENDGATATTMHGWMLDTTMESRLLDGDRRYTVSAPATARSALAVGAWTQRGHWQTSTGVNVSTPKNQLSGTAPFSGRGPLRGKGKKPDLLAPGQWTVSAQARSASSPRRVRREGAYAMRRGTSTAAATVAGAVALLLEEEPSLSANRISTLLTETAGADGGERRWTPERGYGRLNLYRAMASLTGSTVATRDLLRYDDPASGEQRTKHTLGGSGADAMAVRFTPPRSGAVTELALHTASGSANRLRDSLSVEIWTDEDGLPERQLGATAQIAPGAIANHTLNVASLTETGVVVEKNTDYHVVIQPGGVDGMLDVMGERRSVEGRSSIRRDGKWEPLAKADLALRVGTALAMDLETPRPTAPRKAAILDETEPVSLSWTGAPEAETYTVHVSPSAAFPPARTDTVRLQSSSFTLTDLDPSIAYYWRVRAERFEYAGEWSPTQSFLVYPSTISAQVARSFGASSTSANYRLVALPGQRTTPVAQTMKGTAGDAWQAFWDTGNAQNAFASFEKTSRFRFRPGNGFWLRSDRRWTVRGSVPSVSLSDDGTYAIDLHDGWNVISNPFELDVSWGAVEAANEGDLSPLWRYSGRFESTSTFASARTGEAFYFLNDRGRDALRIPYPARPDAPSGASKASNLPPALTLSAHRNGQQKAQVRVGVAKAAKDGRDPLDRVAPPSRFTRTTLRLEAGGENVPARQRSLATEYRSTQSDGHSFSLELRAEPGATVELRAEGLEAFEGQQVVLVDPSAGESHDLRNSSSVTVQPDGGARSLRLLVGSSDYVEAQKTVALPNDLQFLPNYPNPFRERTTLEYVLPDPASVRLVVYDVLGRQVRVLVDGKQKAGRHTVQWNGRDESGKRMASGVYLARLVVGGTTKVRKMTFVR